jgi:hypothetical protein
VGKPDEAFDLAFGYFARVGERADQPPLDSRQFTFAWGHCRFLLGDGWVVGDGTGEDVALSQTIRTYRPDDCRSNPDRSGPENGTVYMTPFTSPQDRATPSQESHNAPRLRLLTLV